VYRLFDIYFMSMTKDEINVSLFDEVKKLQREVAGLNEALAISNRSADEQMRYKREAEVERDRMKLSLEHIIETASDALSNKQIPTQGEMPK
jgi:hypothetical protein